jgi:hypothetical protein
MKKLVEIRGLESICRERAMLDSERKIFWLEQAEEWEQRALLEIALNFRECNLDKTSSEAGTSVEP